MSALSRSPSNATRDEEKRKRVEKEQGHPHTYIHPANSLINGNNGPVPATSPGIANGGPGASVGDERPPSRGMVIFSVLFYLVAALVMVMANKWVLNSVSVPLFFLFVQLAIAVLLLHISATLGYFTIPHVHLSTCKGLLPLISINVTGLIFNTYCLQYVDASFYQVARGLVLPFTVFFSHFLLSSRSSFLSLLAVVLVCAGFFLGVSSESLHASPTGTMLGVFSSLTTSVHAIVVKRSLGIVKGSTMDLVYYNNLLSAILLSPLVFLSGEWEAVLQMASIGGRPFRTFLGGAFITGVFGFLICIAGFLSIKVTSPVTHMISSAVRGVIQTFLGMWCFGDIITPGRGFGISFILLGSTLYTWAKEREQRAREAIASHGRPTSLSSSPSFKNATPPLRSSSPSKVMSSVKNLIILTSPSVPRGGNQGSPPLVDEEREKGPSSPGPRTPRNERTAIAPNQYQYQQFNGLSPATATGRRLSFNGTRASPGATGLSLAPASGPGSPAGMASALNGQGHKKTVSLTDLRDILISPNERTKEGKVF